MKKVFIVHGFKGEPNGGWKPWLMSELDKKDVYACALPMPTPYEPKKEEWLKTISDAVNNPSKEIFLVGHSLGVPAVLQYLQSLNRKIGGAVLVSGPSRKLETENPGSQIRKIDNFFEPEFDFDKIKDSCGKFVIIHGDNDDKVPFEHAEFLSDKLNAPLVIIASGGHLSGRQGWSQLPQALESLERIFE